MDNYTIPTYLQIMAKSKSVIQPKVDSHFHRNHASCWSVSQNTTPPQQCAEGGALVFLTQRLTLPHTVELCTHVRVQAAGLLKPHPHLCTSCGTLKAVCFEEGLLLGIHLLIPTACARWLRMCCTRMRVGRLTGVRRLACPSCSSIPAMHTSLTRAKNRRLLCHPELLQGRAAFLAVLQLNSQLGRLRVCLGQGGVRIGDGLGGLFALALNTERNINSCKACQNTLNIWFDCVQKVNGHDGRVVV